MGTTNIILGFGFASLLALMATLIVEVRAMRRSFGARKEGRIRRRANVDAPGFDVRVAPIVFDEPDIDDAMRLRATRLPAPPSRR